MRRNLLTVAPDYISEPTSQTGLKNFRRIPVVDKGTLVGMVGIGDINSWLFFENGMQH